MKKVAAIIGGGSGMGAEAARKLADAGYELAILSSSGKGVALAESFNGIGITGTNRSEDDIKKLLDTAVAKWGRVDVLVNSAGHGPKGDLLELTDAQWAEGMEVYFMNVVRAARLAAPIMQQQGGGAIINISSFSSAEPSLSFPTSSAARAALAAYTKLFADQFAAHNVRMNNVLPGFIDSLPEKAHIREQIPMKRYGRVQEIGALVAHLASDDAAYITGQNIRVDGGLTRSM